MKEGYEVVNVSDVLEQETAQAAGRAANHRRRRRAWHLCSSTLVVTGLTLLVIGWTGVPEMLGQAPQKVGAGVLFSSGDQVLLLKRNSKHNHGCWGLPGGNWEEGDADLQSTALREATEELGSLPSHLITASLLTTRGKHKQKHYTVFVASVSPQEQASFVPDLNEEHSEYQWWDVADLASPATRPALHPVVGKLMQEPLSKQLAAELPKWAAAEAALGASAEAQPVDKKEKIKKLGAGLLFVHGEEVLLLKRNSSHNNETWDLPGGNTELGDRHLFASAKRECEEEMGPLPIFVTESNVRGAILTKRGKHDSKHFTVYVMEAPQDFRDTFTPQLSDESLGWRWWTLDAVVGIKLKHERLEMLFEGKYRKQLQEILGLELRSKDGDDKDDD